MASRWLLATPGKDAKKVLGPRLVALLPTPPSSGKSTSASKDALISTQQGRHSSHQLPHPQPSSAKTRYFQQPELHSQSLTLVVSLAPDWQLKSRLLNSADALPRPCPRPWSNPVISPDATCPCSPPQRGLDSWVTGHLINVIFNLELLQTAD